MQHHLQDEVQHNVSHFLCVCCGVEPVSLFVLVAEKEREQIGTSSDVRLRAPLVN